MKFLLPLCLFFFPVFLLSQDEIVLKNPSFEDFPRLSHTPKSWYNCGFPGESQVDIHPEPGSQFQVTKTAFHGDTYVGMVTRSNRTWESIGQRLNQPLKKEKSYAFSIRLARAEVYLSRGRTENTYNKEVNYNTPIVFLVWGGDKYCGKSEILAASEPVVNKDWEEYDFVLKPQKNHAFITFEAYYDPNIAAPYYGNILLDNCSSIKELDKEEKYYPTEAYTVYEKIKNRQMIDYRSGRKASEKRDAEFEIVSSSTPDTQEKAQEKTEEQSENTTFETKVNISEGPKEKKEEALFVPVVSLTTEEKEAFGVIASPIDFRRNTVELSDTALTALKDLIIEVKEKKKLKLNIHLKEQNTLVNNARQRYLFGVIKTTGLSTERYSFGTETENFVHLKIENRYLDIWLHE